jgi:peroxiredoxin Q/BCP
MLRAMRSPSRSLVLSLAAVCLCFAAACSRDSAPPQPGSATTPNGATAPGTTATPAIAAGEVAVGKPPPDFTAKAHDGTELRLSALKGKPVVLYFYPKDETPGCTKEACAFRDAWKDLEKKGVVLIGISTDSVESHKAFAKHHELPFHLVSDESGAIAKAFGVPNRAGFLGRQSFVIGADGNVKHVYREVDVTKHASEVLADVGS